MGSRLFFACAITAWIIILLGFGPEIHGHFTGATPFPPLIVHIHVAAFFGWLILFTTQVWLIRSRRLAVHRKLGLAAAALLMRKYPSAPKRLMLLATVCVIDAGFGRWLGPWIGRHFGDGYLGFIAVTSWIYHPPAWVPIPRRLIGH
jgi:hypothetical protein